MWADIGVQPRIGNDEIRRVFRAAGRYPAAELIGFAQVKSMCLDIGSFGLAAHGKIFQNTLSPSEQHELHAWSRVFQRQSAAQRPGRPCNEHTPWLEALSMITPRKE